MNCIYSNKNTSLTNPPKILLIEGDKSIRNTVEELLRSEGYEIISFSNGEDAYKNIISKEVKPITLIILDIILPGLNGFELCRKLRQNNFSFPILVISANDSETDKVSALEIGADDYLVKPFGLKEFVARCRALIRRTGLIDSIHNDQQLLIHSNICLYTKEYRATKNDKNLELSPKEYKLLELFMQNPKMVWTREKILEKIWGLGFIGDRKTVDVHIRWLREKIEDEPSTPKFIKTVRGFGYKFS